MSPFACVVPIASFVGKMDYPHSILRYIDIMIGDPSERELHFPRGGSPAESGYGASRISFELKQAS